MDVIGPAYTLIKNHYTGARKALFPRRVRRETNGADAGLLTHGFAQELDRSWSFGASPVGLEIACGKPEGLHGCRGAKVENC